MLVHRTHPANLGRPVLFVGGKAAIGMFSRGYDINNSEKGGHKPKINDDQLVVAG